MQADYPLITREIMARHKGSGAFTKPPLIEPAMPEREKALVTAVYYGETGIAKKLIDEGAPLMTKDSEGSSLLILAAQQGHIDLCMEFIPLIDPNLKNLSGKTALMRSARKGHLEISKMLIENHAEIDMRSGKQGWTALVFAANFAHADVVKLLLSMQADPNIQTFKGWSALMYASRNGDIGMANSLLEAGADASLSNNAGQTAAILAARKGNLDLVRLLEASLQALS